MHRVYLLYALSGFVSLGYQVAWFRIYVDRFGSTNLTFALVVCCFIGGLGAGSLISRRLSRGLAAALSIRDGLRLYGALELAVTATVLLTLATGAVPAGLFGDFPYHLADGVYTRDLGYRLGQIVLAVLCVFTPCLFMGATYPLLCDIYRGVAGRDRFPSAVYAFNTLGACSGVLACLFVLLPWLGHERMFLLLAGLNLFIAVYFLVRGGGGATGSLLPVRTGGQATRGALSVMLLLAVLGGLVSGALEGDMFKRIDFISSGNSAVMALIAFWAILGIFLASWTVSALPGLHLRGIKVAWVVALVAYAGTWALREPLGGLFKLLGEEPVAGLAPEVAQVGFFGGFLDSVGQSLLYVGIWVFPAYFCVSLLLPYVCNRMHADRRHLGLAYGLNTVAFCAGLIAFTLVAPMVSVFYSLKLLPVVFAVAVILLLIVTESRPVPLWKPIAAVAAVAAACLLVPRGFDRGYMVPGGIAATGEVRALKSNGAHTTYVVAAPDGDYLFFDRHPMSATGIPQTNYMRLMAHFPLLAQPAPRRALLICYGVGNTASAIAAHGTIEALDVVELNEKVVETAPEFADVTRSVHEDPRVRFIIDDGRSFLKLAGEPYDLITSEPPPPMQAGIYRLYTREYYEQALARLSPRGMMTQWIPAYQMPAAAVELAIRTFIDVFPNALIFTGGYREFILVGGRAPIDLELLEDRFYEQPAVTADLWRMGVRKPLSLVARVLMGDGALRERFGAGRVVRDTHNDLEFLFHDPGEPEVIVLEPRKILRDIDADRLDCGRELEAVLGHLGRLRYHVAHYPINTLLTARPQDARLADVDWLEATRLLQEATRHEAAGRLRAAHGSLQDALDMAPEQPRVLLLMAGVELRLNMDLAAIDTLHRFMRLEPGEEIGPRLLGAALRRRGKRDEGLAQLRRAVELDPHSPDAREALGDALVRDGELDEGIAELEAAVAMLPDREQTKHRLSIARRRRAEQPSS